MEMIKEKLKKNWMIIVIILSVVLIFKSCINNNKLEKINKTNILAIDSLSKEIIIKNDTIEKLINNSNIQRVSLEKEQEKVRDIKEAKKIIIIRK